MTRAEERYETRRTFIEGHGHLVEQVPIGAQMRVGQAPVATPPEMPATKVRLTVEDVPADLARRVCEGAGLVVVPANFLNPEQLQELGISPASTASGAVPAPLQQVEPPVQNEKLPADAMIERIKQAASFEELNALMANESRKGCLAAAEERAAQLKDQGAS